MEKLILILVWAVLIVFLGGILAISGYSFFVLFSKVEKIDINVLAIIVAAAITFLATIISVQIRKGFERKKDYENEIRKNKTQAYSDFIALYFEIMMGQKPGFKAPSQNHLIRKFFAIFQGVILWCPEHIIKVFANLMTNLRNQGGSDIKGLLSDFGNLIQLIRKDLGQNDENLDYYDFFRIFITDFEDSNLKLE